jgi:hypothetical protein
MNCIPLDLDAVGVAEKMQWVGNHDESHHGMLVWVVRRTTIAKLPL